MRAGPDLDLNNPRPKIVTGVGTMGYIISIYIVLYNNMCLNSVEASFRAGRTLYGITELRIRTNNLSMARRLSPIVVGTETPRPLNYYTKSIKYLIPIILDRRSL